MIKDNFIKDIIKEWMNKEIKAIKRDLSISPVKGKGIAIYGPRRVGKTYLLKDYICSKNKKQKTLFIDFEDPRLLDFEINDFFRILELYKNINKNYPEYIVLDKIQVVNNWEKLVRHLIENNFYVFVTGSSSKLLSKEIATSLRGRTISKLLLSFSFKEFLKLKNFNFDIIKNPGTKDIISIQTHLKEYLSKGGMPEVLTKNLDLYEYIKQYLDVVVFRDLIERFNIKKPLLLKHIINVLISIYSKEYSINKIYNSFVSKNIKLQKNILYEYIEYIYDSLFVFNLHKYTQSIRTRDIYSGKIYLNDILFSKLSNDSSISKNIENSVFLHLLRHYPLNQDLFYYVTKDGYEIDFLIKEGTQIKELIQVTYASSYEEIPEREIRALLHAKEDLKLKDDVPLIVITWDYEAEKEVEWWKKKGKIRFVPLWKFLLLSHI